MPSKTPKQSPESSSDYLYKTIRVTRRNGKSTTVSMLPEQYINAVRKFGKPADVDAFVRQVAYDLPADSRNCSALVRKSLDEHLQRMTGLLVAANAQVATVAA